MKKALLLLPSILLAACDRPTSTADVSCDMDKYWERVNMLYLGRPVSRDDFRGTKVDVNVTTYDNYAKVTYENITTTFEKVSEHKYDGTFGCINITYKGNFPGSERTALLHVTGDIANRKIKNYSVEFVGEKENINGKDFVSPHRTCTPVQTEKSDGVIRFNHNYKMPNKIERCINELTRNVLYFHLADENKDGLMIVYKDRAMDLTQKDALSISANWDYKNIKMYKDDGKLEEHEKDACDVVARLKKFVHDVGLDSNKSDTYIAIEREIANCDDESGCIVARGNDGDYVVRVPKVSMFGYPAKGTKNAKFLSVFNPNQYARDGYCLVNVIPQDAMEKLGWTNKTCKYRIYCDAPESMDYDQDYAVEICE